MNKHSGVAIELTRYTVREAIRSRFMWMLGLEVAVALLVGLFLSQVAITERIPALTVFTATFLRIGGVAILILLITSCMAREASDRSLDLLLALPVPRAVLLAGRLGGFAVCALGVALASALALLPFAPFPTVTAWGLSLWVECLLMTTITVFFMSGLSHLGMAIIAALGFYLLARSLAAFSLMAHAQIAVEPGITDQALDLGLRILSWIIPRLDLLTRADWLVGYAVDASAGWAIAQALLVSALSVTAALFDLYRKEF